MKNYFVGPFNYPKDGRHWKTRKTGKRHERPNKTYSHGNYTLAPDFAAFIVPQPVWQAKSQEDKDAAFGEFLAHTVRRKRTATVTSSNGVLTVAARPNIARKPCLSPVFCVFRRLLGN